MTMKEDVLKILDASDDVQDAANTIYQGPKSLAIYTITVGLDKLKSSRRRTRRKELRDEVKPQFKQGPTVGSVVLTESAKRRLAANARDLFGPDGWMIGDLNLGNFTKEQLLSQAENERKSAKGSLRNASFYEALAEPLVPGQQAKDYWKLADAQRVKASVWKDTERRRAALE
jgi:hypothetical protein